MKAQSIEKIEQVINELNQYLSDLKDNKATRQFSSILKEYSLKNYNTEHQDIIDYYVDKYFNGAYLTKKSKYADRSDARNVKSDYEVFALKELTENFMKEHFIKVQNPFWQCYKNKLDMPGEYSNSKDKAIPAKRILETINQIKKEKKK